ncbi:MAG: HAD-IA family hydrolase [Acidobacteriota bacterium]|nr:HAD-IA family hydrolase [Acidobacteriota bacterium]MDE3170516.1 HAD-IA family hydrolase [Acidobacteriota bacterium]
MTDRHDQARNGRNGKFAAVRVVMFDLDGTLIDSRRDLVLSVNATLRYMGRPELPHETIYKLVGSGAAVLVQRALGHGATEDESQRGLEYFLRYYREHMLDNTVAYPGVSEGLTMLKDRSLAVLTNKPVKFSQAILEGLGLAQYFRVVYGGNSFASKKPDPEGARVILRDFQASPAEAMLVGDSAVDVRTARNAGTWSCGVRYGLGPEGFRAHPPDLLLDSLTELRAHLDATLE